MFLSRGGRKVLLLDRATFPREKVCGDGISGRSVGVLQELGILAQFKDVEHLDMYGVTFSSPNGTMTPISAGKQGGSPPGFVCRRIVFDKVLFRNAKKAAAKTIEGFFVKDLLMEGQKVVGVKGDFAGKEMEFRAKVVIGADGSAGMVARRLSARNEDDEHICAGLRCYYDNVSGMRDQIELHFVKEALPGYFWIFPLPGNRANIGIGVMVKDMKKKRLNLQKILTDVVENNPVFKERFKDAKRSTPFKSWMLPYATKRVKMAYDGCVLVGDAASLIDPFTGEGIGNALTSGKYAVRGCPERIREKRLLGEGALGIPGQPLRQHRQRDRDELQDTEMEPEVLHAEFRHRQGKAEQGDTVGHNRCHAEPQQPQGPHGPDVPT